MYSCHCVIDGNEKVNRPFAQIGVSVHRMSLHGAAMWCAGMRSVDTESDGPAIRAVLRRVTVAPLIGSLLPNHHARVSHDGRRVWSEATPFEREKQGDAE